MRAGEATLRHLLDDTGLTPALTHAATTEVVVNAPGRFGVEQDGFWAWHDAPRLTFDRLEAIAVLSARMGGKDVGGAVSSCASALPDGQRVKIVLPPAVAEGTVSLTVRRRALSFVPTLQWLAEGGYFEMLNPAVDWVRYFERDVIGAGRTVVVCGGIGESKTTAAEALVRAIPLGLRVVTVEGSSEWQNLPHQNWQALFFDEADPESATRRVQDAMQLRPDWLCFQEIRGSEAWSLLRAMKIGTPGITTVHAPGARRALSSIESMVKQSDAGRGMDGADIIHQLRQYVHVILHCRRFLPADPSERVRYRMTEVLELGETAAQDRMVSA